MSKHICQPRIKNSNHYQIAMKNYRGTKPNNHMKKYLVLMLMIAMSLGSYAQSEKKMKKNFRVNITRKFDPSLTISFDHTVEGKHGFEKVNTYFRSGFQQSGFNVSDSNPKYKVMMDYKYGYAIANYKMQYSDLVAEIVDTETKEIVGTFSYNGRYENDYLGPAVAKEIKQAVNNLK